MSFYLRNHEHKKNIQLRQGKIQLNQIRGNILNFQDVKTIIKDEKKQISEVLI